MRLAHIFSSAAKPQPTERDDLAGRRARRDFVAQISNLMEMRCIKNLRKYGYFMIDL